MTFRRRPQIVLQNIQLSATSGHAQHAPKLQNVVYFTALFGVRGGSSQRAAPPAAGRKCWKFTGMARLSFLGLT